MEEAKEIEGAPPKVPPAEELLNVELCSEIQRKSLELVLKWRILFKKKSFNVYANGEANAKGQYTPIKKMALALVITPGNCARISPHTLGTHGGGPQGGKWLLHVDGSSRTQGSSASVVITSPYGEDLEFAIKFRFKASSNEVEYEALVIGMRMAHEVRPRLLVTYSDSQLIVK
ncbi:UNVERIFIED_CONTAM: hypothetical protein Scaly_2517300 [Sesamum calycinum]|uniref:RNase H type-1 domain-containing protein n=1 Tax=Sesamum calycinum TaxID=2727403 RepID=A0AAW2LUR2_9LAMI